MKRLLYPALYIRMALYIGAALTAFILIGALAFASIAAWELTGYLETRNSEIGREAAQAVKTGGLPELKQWLQSEAATSPDTGIYILNSEGADILGRPVPDIYQEFVASSIVGSHDQEDNFRPVRLTSEIVAPDDSVYSVFIFPSNITLFGNLATALALIAVALLVIASVAWLIAGRIGKPIGELQRAVRNLADGDIDTRVPESIARRPDELGQLAGDFNAMAEHLNQLIKGREQLMRELSHELRSPLTRLQAALALAAARNQLGKDEQRRIENEIAQMNKVIGEILRYSALDSAISMKIRLVRIDRLLRRLVEVEEIEARSAGCSIELDSERNLEVAGDPELLNSALENILRNAIRYAPAGSVVSLQALRDGGDICVTIRDRGPGVDEDQLERIFEPYVRNGGDSGGTGLGLAIVQRVIERHGGSVYAECAAEGGLTMTARIPTADFS